MSSFPDDLALAQYLGEDFGTDTARPTALLEMAAALIRGYTGQSFDQGTDAVAILSAARSSVLYLPHFPVTAVSSVTVDSALDSLSTPTELVYPDDYTWDSSGRLTRSRDRWWWVTTPTAQVTVVYTHGYDRVPGDVAAVCLAVATRMFSNPLGTTSERIGTYAETTSATGSSFTVDEQAVLDRYRAIVVA